MLFIFGLGVAGSPGQLIAVSGNNLAIAAGDTSPSLADHTDFGPVEVLSGFVDRVFTIHNTGEAPLQIIGLQRIGTAAAEFTVPIPPAPVVAGGAGTSFTVRFNPALPGRRSVTIRIRSNASNEPIFDFAITGLGTSPAPEIDLRGNGLPIANGDALPRLADHTDFGEVDLAAGGGHPDIHDSQPR